MLALSDFEQIQLEKSNFGNCHIYIVYESESTNPIFVCVSCLFGGEGGPYSVDLPGIWWNPKPRKDPALLLGIGLQLTNILRDVGEDISMFYALAKRCDPNLTILHNKNISPAL
jgi:hypothetical protein